MDRIKQAVLEEIRMGTHPDMVIEILHKLITSIADARKYRASSLVAEISQAIHDCQFRP